MSTLARHAVACGARAWKNGDWPGLPSIGRRSSASDGDSGLAITSAYADAELLKARGRLNEAGERYEKSLQYAKRHGGASLRAAPNLHLGLSELCCERDDLEGAAGHLRQAEEMGIFPPRTPYRHLLAQARLRQSQGDLAGAIDLLDEAERLYVRGAVPEVRPLAAWRIRLKLAQGRFDDALEWTQAQRLSDNDELRYEREYDHITLARVLLAGCATGGGAEKAGADPPASSGCERRGSGRAARRGTRNPGAAGAHSAGVGRCPRWLQFRTRFPRFLPPEDYVRTFWTRSADADAPRHAVAQA